MGDLNVAWMSRAAIGLGVFSLALCGVMLAGSMLWPDQAERYKKQIQNVIFGLVLFGISSGLAGLFVFN